MKFSLTKPAAAIAVLLGTTMLAQAADIPRPLYKGTPRSVAAYPMWTGFYAGVNGGWGQSKVDWSFVGLGTAADHKGSGALLGGTVGYNYQVSSWVFGAEGDWGWANIKGSTSCPNALFTCASTVSSLGTIRGRAGYAWNNLLLYATAGYAFGNVKAEITGPTNASQTKMASGMAYGAGLEYSFMGNWSAKVEYLYANLGAQTYTLSNAGSPVDVKAPVQVFRAGLNYRFSGPLFSRF